MMKKIYYFSMYFLFGLVYINEFKLVNENIFVVLSSLGIILLLIASLSLTRGFQLYVSIISLILGHVILFKYNLSFTIWHTSLSKIIGLPILFVVIPMISFPIKYGDYLDKIESYVVSQKDKPIYLFSLLALIHLALTIVLNIASIPTMQKLIEKIKLPKKYLCRFYTAGYSSYMVFSPYDGLVNMILLITTLTYSQYFFSGLIMVCSIIAVSAFLIRIDKGLLQEFNSCLADMESKGDTKKVYELLIHILVLIILASLGQSMIPLSNQLYIIAVIIIFYSLFWGLLIKGLKNYKDELKNYSANLLNFKTFIPFLTSTSFLGSVVAYTPIKENIGVILGAINAFPLYLIVQLFILLTVILSVCGVHMMITVTTLALTISPQFIGLSNIGFALTLLTCWYISMSISPFVPFTVIVAETIGAKPLDVAFKYNLKFSLAMLFLAPGIILLVNYLT